MVMCKIIYYQGSKLYNNPQLKLPQTSNFISDDRSYSEFFAKHFIDPESAQIHQYTLLQKAARSGCISKSTFLLEKVMDARWAISNNLQICMTVFIPP